MAIRWPSSGLMEVAIRWPASMCSAESLVASVSCTNVTQQARVTPPFGPPPSHHRKFTVDHDQPPPNVERYRVVRPRLHDMGYFSDRMVRLYLNVAEFGIVAYIQIANLRADLISALVERWQPETHTFHLLCKETTITLDDVAVQLGLSVNGEAITGPKKVLRQFDCKQPTLDPPHILGEIYGIDKKGRDHIYWANQHAPYIFLWNARHERTRTRSCRNRVPPFRNTDSVSNTDPEPDYEASKETSHTPNLNPTSLKDIFGEDPEPQHIFGSAPPVLQYPNTPDDGVYDYTSFYNTPEGTPEVGPSNYQMP
ncbi:hypothetical protein Gotri_007446 [Gossypium trilobum]|uniref:Aminotransferase-like plant mobile domain-containing protein n=1 Tax=Gossypium trilobum TaxID=34281 RepID=A0A7J9EG53_9ROSI|nr:hypothetical protein [Gossypium trilobum]